MLFRSLHIAGHGEFALNRSGGGARTGVLLSDGLMLTAAEVKQMEIVPDLVFLNCCHLGTIDNQPVSRGVEVNKLAASIARELIQMGVRAIVVAGWAVDDSASQHFAEVFYRSLLEQGQPFGPAVHQARLQTWRRFGTTNTWGAFQAYGDPGFLLDPSRPAAGSAAGTSVFVAPEELVDQLKRLRESLKRPGGLTRTTTLAALKRDIAALLARAPEPWAQRGDVNHAIAGVYADFGPASFTEACAHYQLAIEREEDAGLVPIQAIQQLANLEVRSAEIHKDATALAEIHRGARRLQMLTATVAQDPDQAADPTSERCGLLGSGYKRCAVKLAQLALESGTSDPAALAPMREALEQARDWYSRGEGVMGSEQFKPYCALNRIAITALLADPQAAHHQEEIRELLKLTRHAGDVAQANFGRSLDYWDAMMPADAFLIESMLRGDLAQENTAKREAAISAVVSRYGLARATVLEQARFWNSVTAQIVILADLAEAVSHGQLASSLRRIAALLHGDATSQAREAQTPRGESNTPAAERKPRRRRAT